MFRSFHYFRKAIKKSQLYDSNCLVLETLSLDIFDHPAHCTLHNTIETAAHGPHRAANH